MCIKKQVKTKMHTVGSNPSPQNRLDTKVPATNKQQFLKAAGILILLNMIILNLICTLCKFIFSISSHSHFTYYRWERFPTIMVGNRFQGS